jgi:hypothetical protein
MERSGRAIARPFLTDSHNKRATSRFPGAILRHSPQRLMIIVMLIPALETTQPFSHPYFF